MIGQRTAGLHVLGERRFVVALQQPPDRFVVLGEQIRDPARVGSGVRETGVVDRGLDVVDAGSPAEHRLADSRLHLAIASLTGSDQLVDVRDPGLREPCVVM